MTDDAVELSSPTPLRVYLAWIGLNAVGLGVGSLGFLICAPNWINFLGRIAFPLVTVISDFPTRNSHFRCGNFYNWRNGFDYCFSSSSDLNLDIPEAVSETRYVSWKMAIDLRYRMDCFGSTGWLCIFGE